MAAAPDGVPWHRVINSQGRISLRSHDGGSDLQRALLEKEGVRFDATGRVDLQRVGWPPPPSERKPVGKRTQTAKHKQGKEPGRRAHGKDE